VTGHEQLAVAHREDGHPGSLFSHRFAPDKLVARDASFSIQS
jgi:hypothetical protein